MGTFSRREEGCYSNHGAEGLPRICWRRYATSMYWGMQASASYPAQVLRRTDAPPVDVVLRLNQVWPPHRPGRQRRDARHLLDDHAR